MTLDYSNKGKVKLLMLNYVKEVLSSWDSVKNQQDADGFDIVLSKKKVHSAAPDDLFKVDKSCTTLNKECSKVFHHIVAKVLLLRSNQGLICEWSLHF